MKYILVTGGVISGVGKGVIASSIGTLLRCHGIKITSIKIDPYINIDAGTFSPYEHGEVFVLDDGGEVDLDLGNYERFMDITLNSANNITTGKVFLDVITNERKGNFLGKTVQVVPHITDAIQKWVEEVAKVPVDDSLIEPQICIIELGGTVGDIESMPFVEAFRQFQFKVGRENFCVVHVSLIPQLPSGEQKTKPTQSSVRELRGLGLSPDFIVARCVDKLLDNVIEKLAHFCHVNTQQVLALPDVSNIYQVPVIIEQQKFIHQLFTKLSIGTENAPLNTHYFSKWQSIADRYDKAENGVEIALVGKYTQFEDSYTSVIKALQHAALATDHKIKIHMIESLRLEPEHKVQHEKEYITAWETLQKSRGLIVPGGFGTRGIEGKILAIKWARENKIPFLGICLGMQLALVEFARNVLGLKNANSAEFLDIPPLNKENTTPNVPQDIEVPAVIIKEMPEFNPLNKGGTMRLGKRTTIFTNTLSSHKRHQPYISNVKKLYGDVDRVDERHRHRFEFNMDYFSDFEAKGMHFVGQDESGERMEIIELEDHPYFVGTQFHPEYKTRPLKPSPVYYGLILATLGELDQVLNNNTNTNDSNQINNEILCADKISSQLTLKDNNTFDLNKTNSPCDNCSITQQQPFVENNQIHENAKHKSCDILLKNTPSINGNYSIDINNNLDNAQMTNSKQSNENFLPLKPSLTSTKPYHNVLSMVNGGLPTKTPNISYNNQNHNNGNTSPLLHPRIIMSQERMFSSPEKIIT